jgi:hypothetical protein
MTAHPYPSQVCLQYLLPLTGSSGIFRKPLFGLLSGALAPRDTHMLLHSGMLKSSTGQHVERASLRACTSGFLLWLYVHDESSPPAAFAVSSCL